MRTLREFLCFMLGALVCLIFITIYEIWGEPTLPEEDVQKEQTPVPYDKEDTQPVRLDSRSEILRNVYAEFVAYVTTSGSITMLENLKK